MHTILKDAVIHSDKITNVMTICPHPAATPMFQYAVRLAESGTITMARTLERVQLVVSLYTTPFSAYETSIRCGSSAVNDTTVGKSRALELACTALESRFQGRLQWTGGGRERDLQWAIGIASRGRPSLAIRSGISLVPQAVRELARVPGGLERACPAVTAVDGAVVAMIDISAELMKATLCSLDLLNAMRNTTVILRADPLASSANEADHIHTLKIHIGIGIGSMLQVYVGSDGIEQGQRPRREFFIAGNAVVEAGELLNNAKSGEVAMPARAFALLEKHLDKSLGASSIRTAEVVVISDKTDLCALSRELRGSPSTYSSATGPPAASSEGELGDFEDGDTNIDAGLLPFLEESLAARISKAAVNWHSIREPQTISKRGSAVDGRASILTNRQRNMDLDVGQLRNVSIVFIRFSALSVDNMDDPQKLSMAQAVFGIIMETLRRLDGCLRQFACDDKATSALIVFGLAGFAHEKGEEKVACLAAWEICAKLRMLMGPGFSIGVTSGRVFYGIVGNENRSDSTCMGAAVNLAARIMTHPHSAGRVVCDEPTYAKSSHDFTFEALPEVHFKGSDAPKRITQFKDVEKGKARGDTPRRLFGRDREMSSMLEQVEKWIAGETVRLVVLGRSGSGKTALSGWLKSALEVKCRDIVVGYDYEEMACVLTFYVFRTAYGIDVMQNFYYHNLEQILTSTGRQLLELLEDGKLTASQPKEDGDIVSAKSDLGPELNTIIAATIANAINTLTSVLHTKMVLILEDLQWIDSTTFDIVLQFMAKCPAALIICLSRPEEELKASMKPGFANLLSAAKVFELKFLDQDSTTELIKSQVDRLCPNLQVVLRVAASHGQYFEISIIAEVIKQLVAFEQADVTVDYIRELIETEDTFHFIIMSDEICSFSHFLIQQAILKSSTPSWLETVHMQFVIFYETVLSGKNEGRIITSLLHHLMKVPGETERKQKYLKAAFIIAAELYRADEGFEYYRLLEESQVPRKLSLSEELHESMHLVHLYMQAGDPLTIFEVLQKCFTRLGFKFPLVKDGTGKTLRLILKLFLRFLKISSTSDVKRQPLLYRTLNELFPEFLKELGTNANRRGQVADGSKLEAVLRAGDDILNVVSTNAHIALATRNGLEAVLLFLIRAMLCPIVGPNFKVTQACVTAHLNLVFYFDLPLFSKMLSRRQTVIHFNTEEAGKLDSFSLAMYSGLCLGLAVLGNCECRWEYAHRWVGITAEIDPLLNRDIMEYGRNCRQSLFFTSRVVGDYTVFRRIIKNILDAYTEIDIGECVYAESNLYSAAILLIDGSFSEAEQIAT
ncbi:hypothetical protein HK101_004452 [Irineochytrium annulatum]|nr:hypothetical protein HK101_004452 [Irineochytrium annulatum]